MRMVCISDPTAKRSAASLAVNVGCCADPKGLQGMAHALEHMLFMGTKKYPGPDAFEAYLTQHDGSTNASTGSLVTNYRFDVNNSGMRGALDRFAQFFVAPLLDPECIDRELQAVEAEFRTDCQSESRRSEHILWVTGCRDHPVSQFQCGNRASLQIAAEKLGVSLADQVAGFYKRYYSADIMVLAVVGGAPIDQLVDWTVEAFSPVPSRGNTQPAFGDLRPLCAQKVGTIMRYQALTDKTAIVLSFSVPQTSHLYRTYPGHFIGSLLSGAGPGSLLARLKRLHWAQSLTAKTELRVGEGACLFNITIEATTAGFERYEELVAYVFAYLQVVCREQGQWQRYFEELQAQGRIQFYHGEPMPPVTMAMHQAAQMCNRHISPRHAISGWQMVYEYDDEAVAEFLSFLSPTNYRLILSAKSFTNLPRADPYMDIPFGEESMPAYLAADIHTTMAGLEYRDALSFPKPNGFLPSAADISAADISAADISSANNAIETRDKENSPEDSLYHAPTLLIHDELGELWIKRFYSTQSLARGSLRMSIDGALGPMCPRTMVLNSLLHRIVQEQLAEELHAAERAGITYATEVGTGHCMFSVRVTGLQARLAWVLVAVARTLRTVAGGDQGAFAKHVGQLHRAATTLKLSFPWFHAMREQMYLSVASTWHPADWEHELSRVTLADLQHFARTALTQVRLSILAVGRYTDTDALGILHDVRHALQAKPPALPILQARAVDIRPGTYVRRIVHSNTGNTDNAVNYAVCADESLRSEAHVMLLAKMMAAPFFDQLRTREQLGYLVGCAWDRPEAGGPVRIQLAVQGCANPEYMCLRIEAFLHSFRKRLASMDASELATVIDAHVTANMELPHRAAKVGAWFWPAIRDGSYDFEHPARLNRELQRLGRADLLRFWDTVVNPVSEAPGRTRVVVQVWSTSLPWVPASSMAAFPPPLVCLHLCLVQAGASLLTLVGLAQFVASSTSSVDIDQVQAQLAALCTTGSESQSEKVTPAGRRDIRSDMQIRTALEMALQSDTAHSLPSPRPTLPPDIPNFDNCGMSRITPQT
ncbi:metalloprotease [Coemansia sp. RSA 552]|nr:metalloprotease [Coemansia sp. RSA 552]